MSDFQSIPILDYALIERGERTKFVSQLRHAFVNVGFCYLKNPPIAKEDIESVIDFTPRLFEMEQAEKNRVAMVNTPYFLGYNRFGSELTRGSVDRREQFDFGTPYQCQYGPDGPDHLRWWGESQWPKEDVLPGFKEAFLRYLAQVEKICWEFIDFLTEALSLPPGALDQYFEQPKEAMQHRSKVIKYPVVDGATGNQGVGPHFDPGFLTLLLQVSQHKGLQVQNHSGKWIDVAPIQGTLVVNIGKGLEAVTQGVVRATSHRVLSPQGDVPGPRYSIPFFQSIRQDLHLNELVLPISPDVLALKEARGGTGPTDSVNFSEYGHEYSGLVVLIGRVKSHPDVGHRHYPALYKRIFGTDELVEYGSY